MDIPLVPIGNSRGIRLPKALIAQCGFGDRVNLTVTDEGILLSPIRNVRTAWEDALIASPPDTASEADEFRDFNEVGGDFDSSEWTWPQKP